MAAYGFDLGTGTTVADQSGNNNTGTLANTAWAGAGAGKFGNALSFNGTSSAVTIADSNSLDLTGGMTLEAWVKPAVTMSAYRTVVVKEQPGNLVYGLYANSDTNRPEAQVTVGGSPKPLAGTTQLPAGSWSHLAATYDGTTERLYLNGTQISTLAISGSILTSTGNLKIGGNSIWGEWFNGLIDEVRVYNRALSAAEIGADMNSSISSPDTTPPSAPGTLTATGGLGQINLTWGAATDNVGVSKYDLYRGTSPGFTPTTSNRIAQPTTTNYTDTSLPPAPTTTKPPPKTPPATPAPSPTKQPQTPPPTPPRRRSPDRPGGGFHGLGHGHRDGERLRQRLRRRGSVQGRRDESRRRRHDGSVLGVVGHVQRRQRAAHALRRRPRRRREHHAGRERRRHRVEHGLAGPRRRVGLRRGQRHHGRPTSPAREQRHGRERHLGDERASSTRRCSSTGRTLCVTVPDSRRST